MRSSITPVVFVLALLPLSGCREYGISRGEDDVLAMGSFDATTTIERGVTLGNRTLTLDGANLSVDLRAGVADPAALSFSITTRGASDDAAAAMLDKVTIDESGDERGYRYKVTSPQDAVTIVTVSGTVPARNPIVVRSGNGNVKVANLDALLTVSIGNGDILVTDASGNVELQTANGDVSLAYAVMPPGVQARAVAANGDLSLEIPSGLNARVDARTSSGHISVPDKMFDREEYSVSGVGGRFVGHQGDGGAVVSLQTQNGDIAIGIAKVPASSSIPTSEGEPGEDPTQEADDAPIDSAGTVSTTAPERTPSSPSAIPDPSIEPGATGDPERGVQPDTSAVPQV